MEVFEARDEFIIQNGEHALWCNRSDGSLSARRGNKITISAQYLLNFHSFPVS